MQSAFLLCALFFCAPLHADKVNFSLIISEQLRSTFTLVGSGARAAGMAGAFTAVADDATAASFNPAGLAQLVLPEASLVLDRGRVKDEYRNFVLDSEGLALPSTDSSALFHRTNFNFLSFTFPFEFGNRRWAVQFSTQKAVDLTYHGDRRYSQTDPLGIINIRQKSDQSGGIRLYSCSLAVSATPRMLLGITINRWNGDWNFEGLSAETPVEDPEQTDSLTYTQSNELSGWNFDLGFLLRYKYGNIGLRYRSPFSANYHLEASVKTNIVDEPPPPFLPTRASLEWPSTLNFGVVVKPNDDLSVAVDYGRTDWSSMVIDFAAPIGSVNFFDLRSPGTTRVKPAQDWRIGAEYVFFAGPAVLPVRGGWFYEPQPGIDRETGKRFVGKGLAVGCGIKVHWFAMDLAFQHKTSSALATLFEPDDLVINDFSNPSIGTIERHENRLFISTILQLPEEWIHHVFVGR